MTREEDMPTKTSTGILTSVQFSNQVDMICNVKQVPDELAGLEMVVGNTGLLL